MPDSFDFFAFLFTPGCELTRPSDQNYDHDQLTKTLGKLIQSLVGTVKDPWPTDI